MCEPNCIHRIEFVKLFLSSKKITFVRTEDGILGMSPANSIFSKYKGM